MNEYWNSLLTEKSWKILQELRNYNFILIGGWAVYLHAKKQKSKDIDIVVGIKELEKLKKFGLNKNDNLRKYEIKREETDIDIYVEYYSKLTIPAEDIKNYSVNIEGFKVASKELLLILKQDAFKNREFSVKGEKDMIDIMNLLLFCEIDFKEYGRILEMYKIESYFNELRKMIINFKDYNALNLNPREFKIKKNKILERLKSL